MTIPMSNSGDSSVTLSNDSFNESYNIDDDNVEDITYITEVSLIIFETFLFLINLL